MVTITNMIDTSNFSPSNHGIAKKRVIITARLTPQKNVLCFLDALSHVNLPHSEVHFDWFGKIHSTQYYDEIKEKVEELGLSKLITFHDKGCDNIQDEYRNSSHFCLPSIYEGFPNALCEAMSCGLICCASNICDNPYILEDERFLFDPFSIEDMVSKLRFSLSLQGEDAQKISIRNRMRIESLCSEADFAKKYISLLS